MKQKIKPEERIPDDGYKKSNCRTRCPYCKQGKVIVREKRTIKSHDDDFRKDYARRRRQCLSCGQRWSTVEIHSSIWKLIRQIIDASSEGV